MLFALLYLLLRRVVRLIAGSSNDLDRDIELAVLRLRDTKTLIHHAATAWYSWIRPPRRSCRLISGTIVTGSKWLALQGTRSSIPR